MEIQQQLRLQEQLPARSGQKGEWVNNRDVILAELEEEDLADRRFRAFKRNH